MFFVEHIPVVDALFEGKSERACARARAMRVDERASGL